MYYISVHHFEQWRSNARALLQRKISPADVSWNALESSASLFEQNSDNFIDKGVIQASINISKTFMQLAKNVACYRDPQRWGLLYRVAWRLVYENKELLNDTIDPDIAKLYTMNKSISRDKHKMAAFVRFQRIKCINDNNNEEYYMAWFEPEHLILPIKVSFFVKRFTNMRWSIITPDMCAHWDLRTLQLTPGVKRPNNLHDELETLWLEYYKNIFNPTRLKTKAMLSEMPKKYWHNLPEAMLIKDLTRDAQAQMESMIDTPEFTVFEKTKKSKLIQKKQQSLQKSRLQKSE